MPGLGPSWRLWAAETLEIPKLLASPLQSAVPIPQGNGQPVVVYPGYLTSNVSSIRLRRSLIAAGYAAYGWELGQNKGARADLLQRLEPQLERLALRHGQQVTLIGWSLGGLFAREVAKHRPDLVKMVITLGSPFSGDPRANNAWRLYEWLNDHSVENPPIGGDIAEKPPVRTLAVWSPIDGIVAPLAARGQPGESDRQIELKVRHLSLARAPAGIRLIGSLLDEVLSG
ncbi:MAG: alpha/beta fold hydrolase [Novosphingobium sp.]|uniref:esterase/lipase family protein n=1 Tax=Novosphingobium sp. TaxID=1874826 RepID=UPI003C7AEF27